MKCFLGFDKARLNTTFSYIVKNQVEAILRKKGVEITYSLEEEGIDNAFLCSAIDGVPYYPALAKKKIPYSVLAMSDCADYLYTKESVTLNQNSYNIYKHAEKVYVFFPSQAEFLKVNQITDSIVYLRISPELISDFHISDIEKNSFRSYYQISPNQKIVISFGSYDNPNNGKIESVAITHPYIEFLFFGDGEKKSISKGYMDSMMTPQNLKYLPVLPEMFYPSFFYNVNAVILMQNSLSFPTFLFDIIAHEIPIFSYRNHNMLQEVINDKTAFVADSISSLYYMMEQLDWRSKTKEAKEILKEKMKDTQLETYTRKD